MLEKVDLTKKLKKIAYKKALPQLQNRLYALQKASWDAKVPVIIVFEGWDASGKGTSIQKLTAPLDPRGFEVHAVRESQAYESVHPWLWRFWLKIPARGQWAIFDRSWYGRVMVERCEKLTPERQWRHGYRDIVDFEQALANDGYLIIKFFLHISKQEQKRRFKKLSGDPLTAWHVTHQDWVQHGKYAQYVKAAEEMLERTETEWGPWTIVAATDRRHTRIKIFNTIIETLEHRLQRMHALPPVLDQLAVADKPAATGDPIQTTADLAPKVETPAKTPRRRRRTTRPKTAPQPGESATAANGAPQATTDAGVPAKDAAQMADNAQAIESTPPATRAPRRRRTTKPKAATPPATRAPRRRTTKPKVAAPPATRAPRRRRAAKPKMATQPGDKAPPPNAAA